MIRVLHVVTYMGRGGLETMIMNYYRNIDRSQIQFDFLTHRDFKADYDDEIESMGGIIYNLPPLNPFSASYRKALSKFFDKHTEYKIIHVHQDCMSSVILKEAYKQGVPVRVAHSHNCSQDKNAKYLIKLFYKKFISKYSTHLFACSKEAGDWMFGQTKFKVINNAIDASKYTYNENMRKKMRQKFELSVEELLIGHVGRFNLPKNHSYLLDVFQLVQSSVKAKLFLVGDGYLRNEIEKKIQMLGLEDKVILAGVCDNVNEILQAIDVFLFPSLYEGLPVSIVEAQASGLPCLISDKVPIECKKTDLVYQMNLTDSAEKWADKVIELSKIKRVNTYEQIKASGYDIKENAKMLTDFYIEEYNKIIK